MVAAPRSGSSFARRATRAVCLEVVWRASLKASQAPEMNCSASRAKRPATPAANQVLAASGRLRGLAGWTWFGPLRRCRRRPTPARASRKRWKFEIPIRARLVGWGGARRAARGTPKWEAEERNSTWRTKIDRCKCRVPFVSLARRSRQHKSRRDFESRPSNLTLFSPMGPQVVGKCRRQLAASQFNLPPAPPAGPRDRSRCAAAMRRGPESSRAPAGD